MTNGPVNNSLDDYETQSTWITDSLRKADNILTIHFFSICVLACKLGESNKLLLDYKYKLQKAEQDIASLQGSLARAETQVIRYKTTAEAAEKAEGELKVERRKLQREVIFVFQVAFFSVSSIRFHIHILYVWFNV